MDEVLTLAKPRKKGLVSLIFSRFFVIVILLAIQIAFIVVFNVWLHDYMPLYTALMMTLTIVGVIYLFNSGMDSSAKLTWMFIIAILPIAGVAMLAFSQTSIGNRKLKHRVQELIAGSREVIRQPEGVMEKLSGDLSGTQDLNWYLNQSNCFPLYDNTRTDFFPLGEDMFASMLEDLKKAEKFIFMEFFIIDEGYMWGSILKILADKAAAGVDVRVMYDGMLEVSTLPSNYCSLLQKRGIKAKAFSPIKPIVSSHYNYRDHRKILVIDEGKIRPLEGHGPQIGGGGSQVLHTSVPPDVEHRREGSGL